MSRSTIDRQRHLLCHHQPTGQYEDIDRLVEVDDTEKIFSNRQTSGGDRSRSRFRARRDAERGREGPMEKTTEDYISERFG